MIGEKCVKTEALIEHRKGGHIKSTNEHEWQKNTYTKNHVHGYKKEIMRKLRKKKSVRSPKTPL